MSGDLLDEVLSLRPSAFALLHRPAEAVGHETVDVLVGDVSTPETLAGIPLPATSHTSGARHDVLTVVPFRQIFERGFACPDDHTPLITMTVTDQSTVSRSEVLTRLPEDQIHLVGQRFEPDDVGYAETVRRVVTDEIGQGEGSNFVIKRSFLADMANYSLQQALTFYRHLLKRESGAYWTFLVHTGSRTLVGATPERHISQRAGTAVMNPISGTYRYPPNGPSLPEVLRFLEDQKEADELYMVVDEELKMMARICATGGRVVGPYLKEMSRLAHTEYFISGTCTRDPRETLRETMFAPTVTGSPLESAFRVIARHEPEGRGYYSGIIALIGQDERGERLLDSALMIRAADIDNGGRLRIGLGSTLVRHSEPDGENAETRAKAAGLLTALESTDAQPLGSHPSVRTALNRRNASIATFWQEGQPGQDQGDPALTGKSVLIVDAEDTFTAMLEHQLRSLGLWVVVRHCAEAAEAADFDEYDLIVMGPGPGDPRDTNQVRIGQMSSGVRTLLDERKPFLAVCLSHQILSLQLGFDVVRRNVPNQGAQRLIDLFGSPRRVGFYNTFTALSSEDKALCSGVGLIEVSGDTETREVHALRGPHFASVQFHAESLLTQDGVQILGDLARETLTV